MLIGAGHKGQGRINSFTVLGFHHITIGREAGELLLCRKREKDNNMERIYSASVQVEILNMGQS